MHSFSLSFFNELFRKNKQDVCFWFNLQDACGQHVKWPEDRKQARTIFHMFLSNIIHTSSMTHENHKKNNVSCCSYTVMYSICDMFSTYLELRWCKLLSVVNVMFWKCNKQTQICTLQHVFLHTTNRPKIIKWELFNTSGGLCCRVWPTCSLRGTLKWSQWTGTHSDTTILHVTVSPDQDFSVF